MPASYSWRPFSAFAGCFSLPAHSASTRGCGAIRELSTQVEQLQANVNALRAGTGSLPALSRETSGWNGGGRDSFAWVRELESPGARHGPVPWLLLEITFLAAVAAGAAVADLSWGAIVAVMAAAWGLVVLAEVAGARSRRHRAEAAYAPVAVYGPGLGSDPSWFAPPIERTVLDAGDEDTGTRLPPPSSA